MGVTRDWGVAVLSTRQREIAGTSVNIEAIAVEHK
jgi:hypothetical protein